MLAGDDVGRIGGDEFLIVLPSCDQANADDLIRRVRSRLERASVELGVGEISVSTGTAAARHGETADALIARADEFMYQQKARARG